MTRFTNRSLFILAAHLGGLGCDAAACPDGRTRAQGECVSPNADDAGPSDAALPPDSRPAFDAGSLDGGRVDSNACDEGACLPRADVIVDWTDGRRPVGGELVGAGLRVAPDVPFIDTNDLIDGDGTIQIVDSPVGRVTRGTRAIRLIKPAGSSRTELRSWIPYFNLWKRNPETTAEEFGEYNAEADFEAIEAEVEGSAVCIGWSEYWDEISLDDAITLYQFRSQAWGRFNREISAGSPAWSFRFRDSNDRYELRSSSGTWADRVSSPELYELQAGRWFDVVVCIRHSYVHEGFVIVWTDEASEGGLAFEEPRAAAADVPTLHNGRDFPNPSHPEAPDLWPAMRFGLYGSNHEGSWSRTFGPMRWERLDEPALDSAELRSAFEAVRPR